MSEKKISSFLFAPDTKIKDGLSKEQRRAIWIFHIGLTVKESVCMVCGKTKILAQDIAASFVGAHIVAKDHCPEHFKMTPYMIIPTCVACNLTMGKECIINILWHSKRIHVIKELSWRIYLGLLAENAEFCAEYDNQMWKIVQHLWGSEGIGELGYSINPNIETDLYIMLKAYQMEKLNGEITELSGSLQKKAKCLDSLAQSIVPPFNKNWV